MPHSRWSRVVLSVSIGLFVGLGAGAAPAWSATPIKERAQVFYRYKALFEKNLDELPALVTKRTARCAARRRRKC